ncbi:MAG: DUF2283 domain-containing protein [Pseudomonadota bacterium]
MWLHIIGVAICRFQSEPRHQHGSAFFARPDCRPPGHEVQQCRLHRHQTISRCEAGQASEAQALRSVYFEEGDILYLLLSDKPVQREAAQDGHTSIGFAADGSIVKVFCLKARRQVVPV